MRTGPGRTDSASTRPPVSDTRPRDPRRRRAWAAGWSCLLIAVLTGCGAARPAPVATSRPARAQLSAPLGSPPTPPGGRPGAPAPTASTPVPTLARVPVHPAGWPRGLPVASVRIPDDAPGIPVPRSFLGISTEYGDVSAFAEHARLLHRVLGLLHVPGGGPLLLRVGGDSASLAALDGSPRISDPLWAQFELTPAFFRRLGQLVRLERVRLILDLNTADRSPGGAVAVARAALANLPRHRLQALEVGNEPDLYGYWHARFADLRAARIPTLMRMGGLTPSRYAAIFAAYVRFLHAALPHVALTGPALAQPNLDLAWQRDAMARAGGVVSAVTGHRYPLSGCVTQPSSSQFPTRTRILSNAVSFGMARSLMPAVAAAHALGRPYLLTEFNSVTCGGRPGVSNSFATALWAPDALLSLVRAGVDAANLHVRIHAVNTPFTFAGGELVARPLLYGLALFARTLTPGARLLDGRVMLPHHPWVHVWALRSPAGLRILLLDKGARPIVVRLRVPATGAGTVQRLLAPSAAAQSGVRLAGQAIDARGAWQGPRVRERIAVSARGWTWLELPAHSAALVSLR